MSPEFKIFKETDTIMDNKITGHQRSNVSANYINLNFDLPLFSYKI